MKSIIEYKNKSSGFVKFIVIIIIGVLVLSYYSIDIRGVAESPAAQQNFAYVKGIVVSVWDKYLKEPATYLWNNVFLGLMWTSFIGNMKKIENGEPNDLEANTPKVESNDITVN